MGQIQDHALGRGRKTFIKAEGTFGTPVAITTNNALKLSKPIEFVPDVAQLDRNDNRNTRDLLEQTTGLKTVKFKGESYLLPSGAAGTAPNIGPLLKNALGSETITGGVSVAYGLTNVQNMGSLSIFQQMNAVMGETAMGAFIEEITLKVSGKEEAKLSFSGMAQDYGMCGTGSITSNLVGGETSLTVAAADRYGMAKGAVIQVIGAATSNGGGNGHLVTAYDPTTGIATFSPAIAGAPGAASTFAPFLPVETTAGSPISPTLASATLDAVALPITAFDITVKNNHKPIDDEAGQATITDYIPGYRSVTGSFTLRGRKDMILHYGKRFSLATRNLSVVAGTIGGKKMTVAVPTLRVKFDAANIPDEDVVMLPFSFVGLGSTGEDSTSWTLT